jgi:protein-tyrosine-phosphatase
MSDFRAAFICTGNRFRSPLAAAIFRAELEDRGIAANVQSFGVLKLTGTPALPEAVHYGNELGVDLSRHRARAIERDVLADVDLVVGFERAHLATAVVDGGAWRDVTYTLPELVELLERTEESPGGARERLALAASRRSVGKTFSGVPEIPDPLGRPGREQHGLAARVADMTRRLARDLFD